METTRERQMEFMGNIGGVNRGGGIEKFVVCGKIQGKKAKLV